MTHFNMTILAGNERRRKIMFKAEFDTLRMIESAAKFCQMASVQNLNIQIDYHHLERATSKISE